MNYDNEEFRFKKIIKSAKDGITKEEILSKFSDEKKDFINFILTVELDKYDVIELDGKYIHIDNIGQELFASILLGTIHIDRRLKTGSEDDM